MRRPATPLAVAGALGLALVVAAACADRPLADCLEPNAQIYSYHLPGSTTKFFHWPRSRMPLRVYAETPLVAPAEAAGIVWTNAMHCAELSFVRVTDSSVADIVIRNPGAMPPAPKSAISAAADSVGACTGRTDLEVDADTNIIAPMRVYVVPNSIVSDTVAIAGCYRFTVTHEMGHAIGLFRHSTDPDDLMFSTPYRRLLTLNDRYTVQKLYNTTPTMSVAP